MEDRRPFQARKICEGSSAEYIGDQIGTKFEKSAGTEDMAMATKELTGPQQKIVEYLEKHGEISKAYLGIKNLDVRAANNLVRARVLTFTNGVYRMRVTTAKSTGNEKASKTEGEKAKPQKTEASAATAKPKKVKELHGCLCGCGEQVKGRFKQGHDARLHSLVLRLYRGTAAKGEAIPDVVETVEYLKSAPWMTDEIRETLRLD
jgi:hypothetical protein